MEQWWKEVPRLTVTEAPQNAERYALPTFSGTTKTSSAILEMLFYLTKRQLLPRPLPNLMNRRCHPLPLPLPLHLKPQLSQGRRRRSAKGKSHTSLLERVYLMFPRMYEYLAEGTTQVDGFIHQR